jgi:hypothetical protein
MIGISASRFSGAGVCLLGLLSPYCVNAQTVTQRGYVETGFFAFPQTRPVDRGHFVADALMRYEAIGTAGPRFSYQVSVDARTDSHRQTERRFDITWSDRVIQRPSFAMRRASLAYSQGAFTLEAGKLFVRWGKTDILTPTDRFTPRDYLTVVENDPLAVTAARVAWSKNADTVEFIYTPRMSPSRTPLLNQRWVVTPSAAATIPINDQGALYPGGPQFGLRWNHAGSRLEHSFSYFEGFNHLPLFQGRFNPASLRLDVLRFYPKIRMIGGDVIAPLAWFTLRGEAAWFQSNDRRADEYILFVAQAERQQGEWLFLGGYTGQKVTNLRNPFQFAPDRGLTQAFVGRVGYTLDSQRSIAFETVVRQNGEGFLGKFEYSHGIGQHWRVIPRVVLIRGSDSDFLGQYRRNSYVSLILRYNF